MAGGERDFVVRAAAGQGHGHGLKLCIGVAEGQIECSATQFLEFPGAAFKLAGKLTVEIVEPAEIEGLGNAGLVFVGQGVAGQEVLLAEAFEALLLIAVFQCGRGICQKNCQE